MPLASYEIAIGYNQSGAVVNIETIVPKPPRSNRVPLGSNTRNTLGGKRITDGSRLVQWVWGALSQSELDDLITTIFTNWNTENVKVTIGTRLRDDTYAYFNAVANLPRANEEYALRIGHIRESVTINFFIVGTAT